MRVSRVITLLSCPLEVMGSKHENSLSPSRGKATYILPSLDFTMVGVSRTRPPFFLNKFRGFSCLLLRYCISFAAFVLKSSFMIRLA